jgi:hypothetical protein
VREESTDTQAVLLPLKAKSRPNILALDFQNGQGVMDRKKRLSFLAFSIGF